MFKIEAGLGALVLFVSQTSARNITTKSRYGKLDPVVGFLDSNLCDRIPVPPGNVGSPVGVLGKNSGLDFLLNTDFDDSFKGVCYFFWTEFLGLGHNISGTGKKCVSVEGHRIRLTATWYVWHIRLHCSLGSRQI